MGGKLLRLDWGGGYACHVWLCYVWMDVVGTLAREGGKGIYVYIDASLEEEDDYIHRYRLSERIFFNTKYDMRDN